MQHFRLNALQDGKFTVEQHLAELVRCREFALANCQAAAAVQAEVARGKVLGLYENQLRIEDDRRLPDALKAIAAHMGADAAAMMASALGVPLDRDEIVH